MSLREQMQASVEELEEVHEKNRLAYRAALNAVNEAQEIKRQACDVASVSANELGAARKALEELDRNQPNLTVVEGEGEVEA